MKSYNHPPPERIRRINIIVLNMSVYVWTGIVTEMFLSFACQSQCIDHLLLRWIIRGRVMAKYSNDRTQLFDGCTALPIDSKPSSKSLNLAICKSVNSLFCHISNLTNFFIDYS